MKTKIVIGVIAFLAIGFLTFGYLWKEERKERKIQDSNVEQLTKNADQVNIELNLSKKEFKDMNTWWSQKIDSVEKANKIKPKQVVSATILNNQYKDTAKTEAVHGKPIVQPNKASNKSSLTSIKPIYKIPVSASAEKNCWFMNGYITSTDPEAKLTITEKGFINSNQLIVNQKRFLGFLWKVGKPKFNAFSDCGTIEFVKIEFRK